MTGLEEHALRQEIEHLTKRHKLAFALLLCERMIPALDKFAREVEFDSSLYHSGLESIWKFLKDDTSSSNYHQIAEECFNGAPDTEDFNHPLTTAALNAALSIAATIRFLADDDVDHIVEATCLARDTAAMHVQAIEAMPPRSLDLDDVMKHPFVQHELRQQAEDLEFVEALPVDDPRQLVSLLKGRVEHFEELLLR